MSFLVSSLIFVSGILVGGIGYSCFKTKSKSSNDTTAKFNVDKKKENNKNDSLYDIVVDIDEVCKDSIVVQEVDPNVSKYVGSEINQYVDYDEIKDDKNATNSGKDISVYKNNGGEDSDINRPNADRKLVSKLVQGEEYDSKDEILPTVDGDDVHLVTESELMENNDSDDEKKIQEPNIENVGAIVFCKAIAAGESLQSFIFNPIIKQLYWNFTFEQVDENEAVELFGRSLVDEILEESNYNSNGWIQPRYLYNRDTKVYMKIETGSTMEPLSDTVISNVEKAYQDMIHKRD